jgi:DNA-binding MarR family transcriptional regulator
VAPLITLRKTDLVKQVIMGARESNIGAILFHQAVGQILGINVTDMKCLDIITLKGSTSPSQLAELTGLSTGATTALIDRLEKRKLIVRHRNPKDRRGTIITLTKEAVRKLPPLFESMAKAMEVLASSYSEKELALLLDYFGKLTVLWTEEREKVRSGQALFANRRAQAGAAGGR